MGILSAETLAGASMMMADTTAANTAADSFAVFPNMSALKMANVNNGGRSNNSQRNSGHRNDMRSL